MELSVLLGAAPLLTAMGYFAKRALPPLTELLVAVLPLLSDRMNERAIRLAKANKQSK
ncbi:hypothetical protein LTV02_19110 [Nocardia yamanashiensis]|uniref:hypothetical protein n=1 Tax=Nocardia yamanashiensis TaxID=209247 RepID=UPI001E5A6F21|nr:hypothetical protein [Nocardia yamanashiensis]UGT45366.1 hypothetical protein LTV02_19110 [Nocardia yamanashiensis]